MFKNRHNHKPQTLLPKLNFSSATTGGNQIHEVHELDIAPPIDLLATPMTTHRKKFKETRKGKIANDIYEQHLEPQVLQAAAPLPAINDQEKKDEDEEDEEVIYYNAHVQETQFNTPSETLVVLPAIRRHIAQNHLIEARKRALALYPDKEEESYDDAHERILIAPPPTPELEEDDDDETLLPSNSSSLEVNYSTYINNAGHTIAEQDELLPSVIPITSQLMGCNPHHAW